MFDWLRRKRADPLRILEASLGELELPSFPAVVTRALEEIRAPEVPLRAIAERISSDPGLSARLLSVTNSPAFSLRREVRNVEHAVALLGRAEVESLLLAVSVKGMLSFTRLRGFDAGAFWRAAARRAVCARDLAARLQPATRSEAFTAALLQDMAVPFLMAARGEDYAELLDDGLATSDLAELERARFGWDHAHVAGSLCERWGFPRPLSDAIGAHHQPHLAQTGLPAAPSLVAELPEGDVEDDDPLLATLHARYGLTSAESAALLRDSLARAETLAATLF